MGEQDVAATTVVCVHGAGAGGWEWGIWARVLVAHGFDVLAPDLAAGAGGLVATRLSDYRAQVRDWCRGLGAPPVLVGASLGGLLAAAAAAEVGAAALVLVNPLPARASAHALPHKPRPALVPWGRERSFARTRRALPDADAAACLYAFRRWRDESGAVLAEATTGVEVAPPRCPVLVVASDADGDVPAAVSRAWAAASEADFHLLAGSSHAGALLGRHAADAALHAAAWLGRRGIASRRGPGLTAL